MALTPSSSGKRRTKCASDVSSAVATDAVVVADRRPEGDDLVHRRVPGRAVERVDVAVGLTGEGEVEARAIDVRVRLVHRDDEHAVTGAQRGANTFV